MADVTWAELRELQADFLNLQLTETANKCVMMISLWNCSCFLFLDYPNEIVWN